MIKWFEPNIDQHYLAESCYLDIIPNEYIETFMIREIRKRIAEHSKKYNLENRFKIIYPPDPTSRTWGYFIKLKK